MHTTKIYNKIVVPKDTIIIPDKTIVIKDVNPDYTYQFWGLLLVILIVAFLWYRKKQTVITAQAPVSNTIASWGMTSWDHIYTDAPQQSKPTNKPRVIEMDDVKPRVNFDAIIGESAITPDAVNTNTDTGNIKDAIKNLRK